MGGVRCAGDRDAAGVVVRRRAATLDQLLQEDALAAGAARDGGGAAAGARVASPHEARKFRREREPVGTVDWPWSTGDAMGSMGADGGARSERQMAAALLLAGGADGSPAGDGAAALGGADDDADDNADRESQRACRACVCSCLCCAAWRVRACGGCEGTGERLRALQSTFCGGRPRSARRRAARPARRRRCRTGRPAAPRLRAPTLRSPAWPRQPSAADSSARARATCAAL